MGYTYSSNIVSAYVVLLICEFPAKIGLLVSIVTVLTITTLIMLVRPADVIANIFEIQHFSYDKTQENLFRIVILVFPLIHVVLAVMIEVSGSDISALVVTFTGPHPI